MLKSIVITLFTLALAFFTQTADAAASETSKPTSDVPGQTSQTIGDLKYSIAPYGWMTSMRGTVGAKGFTTKVDSSFVDIAEYLMFGVMLHAEGLYRDTVGVVIDFNYSSLGEQASRRRVSLEGKSSLLVSDVLAFYRVGSVSLGQSGSYVDFDVLAGIRVWSVSLGMDLDVGPFSRSVYKEKTWVDPVVAGRAQFHLNDKWMLSMRGGVGGFSLGSAITWDASVLIGYTFWEHGTFMAGYKAVGVKHSEGDGDSAFKYDAILYGPVIGVLFTF